MNNRRSVNFFGTLGLCLLMVTNAALAHDGNRPHGAHAPRATQPHTRTTERQRTENGRTRSDTVNRADGSTATRQAAVSNDRNAGTRTRQVEYTGFDETSRNVDSVRTKTDEGVTRSSNYTTADGRQGSKTDVIQRTEDGYSRDTTRTSPDGETHTRSVDVSCDKDAGKCVKQVEAGQQP